ncbi:MAG: Peptidase family protein [Pedosphaera sp.]|nr:Peptidase family protein [Pedosphaera sp.]
MRCPAAPYHEAAVRAEVEKICAEEGLGFKRDTFGNVLVRLQTAPKQRAFVLAAHLDHPAFEIVRPLSKQRWLAQFLGGVPDNYFKKGVPIRLMPGAVPARLGRRIGGKKQFELHARQTPGVPPEFAVWELEDFAVRQNQIHGRACDDLGGVAAILAVLVDLKRQRARVNVIGVISRAEEVGFQGALAVAASRQLPKNSLVVSLETSRELPPVKMGQGVIIRVGDRASIFDSAATRFLTEVATDLQQRRKTFQFQRALMSGGTCEATAYQEFGFQTGAVCVALGNYHNCGERNQIAAEYIAVEDGSGMVELLVAAARKLAVYPKLTGRLPKRLQKLLREGRKKLRPKSR